MGRKCLKPHSVAGRVCLAALCRTRFATSKSLTFFVLIPEQSCPVWSSVQFSLGSWEENWVSEVHFRGCKGAEERRGEERRGEETEKMGGEERRQRRG